MDIPQNPGGVDGYVYAAVCGEWRTESSNAGPRIPYPAAAAIADDAGGNAAAASRDLQQHI